MSEAPLVSICIPTYNRARYLDSLLFSLTEHMARFPHSYEIFVGDNASSDDTAEVVARYSDRLPLRYVRHDSNLGGVANWQHLLMNARGRYFVYVADDDGLMGAELARIIAVMETRPQAGVAYAPWKLLDLVADKEQGQFYQQDDDVLVNQGDFAKLLDTILRYRIFPEIGVYRREVLHRVMPRVSEQAFYAFVHAAEFAQHTEVLFLKDPFYISVTNYFADHVRQQAGTEEAELAWDRYRGGLEHVLGRASAELSREQRAEFLLRIQELIAERISVAVRLRIQRERDPIDTYYLAYRLKAMGAEQLLPMPLAALATHAAVSFLLKDVELNRGLNQLLCVGNFSAELRRLIESKTQLPVRFAADVAALGHVDAHTLVFGLKDITRDTLPPECQASFVHESDLMRKFVA